MVQKQKAQRLPWWFISGSIVYKLVFIAALIGSIAMGARTAESIFFTAVDWISGSIIYFFLGALLGFAIDWIIARRKGQSIKTPAAVWYIALFWATSLIIAWAFITPTSAHGIFKVLFFPFAYGLIFPTSAFVTIFPTLIEKNPYVKSMLDGAFILLFLGWAFLTYSFLRLKTAEQRCRKIARRVLLFILFAVLTTGMISCAVQLKP